MKTTIKKLEDVLNEGHSIFVECHTMVNGGTHRYWIKNHGDGLKTIHCYGSGPNWRDQNDDCSIQDVHELAKHLYHERANIISIEMMEDYCY